MGQHRHLRMARLSHADQDQFPLPRQHSGGADRTGPRPVYGSRSAMWNARHTGMAKFLFQEPDARAGSLSRARSVHSTDEAEEHFTLSPGGGLDYTSRYGVLRLIACVAKVRVSRMPAITEASKPQPMRRLT